MSDRKGFTLIEIVAVSVIIGILTMVAIPNYTTMVTQGAAKAAQDNLISIYNGQKNYYLNTITGGAFYNSGSANDQGGINTALSLNISDTNFEYTCVTAAGPSFTCKATNFSDTNLVLTITSGTTVAPNPIILPGAVSCATSTGGNPGCNPSCATDHVAYCPS